MQAIRRQLQPIAWLTLVAVLALVLLPTMSHALSAASGKTSWSEVCTPQGMRLVAVDDAAGDPAAPVSSAGHLEHCPYCAKSAGAPALASSAPAGLALPVGADALPALFFQAPRTLFAWAAAQPRAPPFLS